MLAYRYALGCLVVAFGSSMTACGDDDVLLPPDAPSGRLPGLVQKGPLVSASTLTIEERDAALTPTGNTFSGSTSDDAGSFSLAGVGITSPFVDVVARGFYYDEVGGSLAGDEVTLRALLDTSAPLANVNVLTTVSRARIVTLVTQGQDFTSATLQARDEALAAFSIMGTGTTAPASMTIADAGPANASLLAVSAIVMNAARRRVDSEALVTAQLNDILQAITTDLEPDGVLDDVALGTELVQAARSLDAAAVRQNLEDYYASLGVPATVPAFETLLPVAAGQFVTAGALSQPRGQHAAHLLSTGQVLVIGGFAQNMGYDDAFLYDPVAESQGPSLPLGNVVSQPVTAAVADEVYVFGLANDGMSPSAATVYSPMTSTFSPIAAYNMPGPLQSFWIGATALQGGTILLIRNQGGPQVQEVFDPLMGTITPTNATLSSHRWDSPSTVLPDGRVLFAGGSCCDMPDQVLGSAELFFPSTNGWGGTSSSLTTARSRHTQTLLDDGRVVIIGGLDSTFGASATIEIFDPTTSSISPSAATLSQGRLFHTATKLADGRVLVAGGENGEMALATAEIYDPATDSVSSVSASMAVPRQFHTATLLPNGTVLLVGGANQGGAVSSVERFIP